MTRVLADWRFWVALVGTLVAFTVASVVAGTATRWWRAETTIVVGIGAGPLRPGEGGATRELAERLDDLVRSDQIAANIVSGLHLRGSRSSLLGRISVHVPEAGLLRVRVRDRDRLRAQQIAQQIGFLFPRFVQHRFPKLKAVVWDPSHFVGRTSRHWGRNLGIAGAVAAALWAAALAAIVRRPRPVVAPPTPPTAAAEPAVVPEPRPVPVAPPPPPEPAPAPVAAAVPEPAAPVPEPAAAAVAAAPAPPAVAAEPGAWNLSDLECVVRERSAEFPDRAEEWEIYLDSMRDFAGPEGQLPASLDWLVWDTFGAVLERAEQK